LIPFSLAKHDAARIIAVLLKIFADHVMFILLSDEKAYLFAVVYE